MPNSPSAAVPVSAEKTFSSYNHEQGTAYAQARRGYHPNLYQIIIDYHTSTGGQLSTILDIGCGPGTAVRELAPRFAHAIGLDPSDGMISTARSLGGVSSSSEPIRFDISTAEELGSHISPPIPDSSVDLITAATAAHWFDMSRFWPRAAQLLKPGGTVAFWTSGSLYVHPSMPNYAAIQAVMDELEERHLKAYMEPGNLLTRNLYADLPLPWTLEQQVPEFDESTFFRKEWNKGGLANAADDGYSLAQQTMDLDTLEKVLGTASPVTRWREAHPDAVGTERDVVRMVRREIERLLCEAGVEKGKEEVTGGVGAVLLMVRKRM
ncbi:methyltransferase domain-containing protein [Zopfia rhizophila CBS 207.26]|uniref:Methyltransferase domain-containing protein n=1 Tax=Zopfia rhizophila CBS 207.26 TaxID=1314779 RepID=A0A6A6EGP7_9PEZI|nr:methyltransferase domain-containing protein [Zopfia rhizophila CBS 207.26]